MPCVPPGCRTGTPKPSSSEEHLGPGLGVLEERHWPKPAEFTIPGEFQWFEVSGVLLEHHHLPGALFQGLNRPKFFVHFWYSFLIPHMTARSTCCVTTSGSNPKLDPSGLFYFPFPSEFPSLWVLFSQHTSSRELLVVQHNTECCNLGIPTIFWVSERFLAPLELPKSCRHHSPLKNGAQIHWDEWSSPAIPAGPAWTKHPGWILPWKIKTMEQELPPVLNWPQDPPGHIPWA